jgi:hypothetical protein
MEGRDGKGREGGRNLLMKGGCDERKEGYNGRNEGRKIMAEGRW